MGDTRVEPQLEGIGAAFLRGGWRLSGQGGCEKITGGISSQTFVAEDMRGEAIGDARVEPSLKGWGRHFFVEVGD